MHYWTARGPKLFLCRGPLLSVSARDGREWTLSSILYRSTPYGNVWILG